LQCPNRFLDITKVRVGALQQMTSTIELLKKLRRIVKAEAETQYDALERQWAKPLSERVAKGWAIEGLWVEGYDKGLIKLRCTTNESRFREGDLVVMHQGNPKDENALHLELQYDAEIELEASIVQGNHTFLLANPAGWIIDQDWFDVSPFYLDALDSATDSARGQSTILPLLQGELKPEIDFPRFSRVMEKLAESGLNETQAEAVGCSYAVDLLHLIQGPPGTGKTLVLAHLAQHLVLEGRRVLVTALTHRAIHNALNKIYEVDDALPVCKIGAYRHVGDLNVPSYEGFSQCEFGDLDGGYIIGATPFACRTNRLANVEFDVVIFDEASQVTLPLAIMGMLAANKFIFIGDDNQLPPVTIFSEDHQTHPSIFAYLSGRGYETMLDTTYRLNQELTIWPSQTFYEGKLLASEGSANRRLHLLGRSSRWEFVLDPDSPAVFLDLGHCNTSVRSHKEAYIVVELLLALMEEGLTPDDVGVVVPYRAQSRLIRSLLRRAVKDEAVWKRFVVDTVERMQGQEREVVIVSFATSSPAFAAQMADFLFQPQRLNVAVTRPRTKLILVGSHHMLDGEQYDPGHAEAFLMLRDLIDHCKHISLPGGELN